MVLGGSHLIWIIVEQGFSAFAAGAGVVLTFFSDLSFLSSFSLILEERYRLNGS